ncbi:MAG: helix-turn-helix domain-containing protein, partial [Spirochaetales bacterium]|nr:helix-turn-helix domain-containing protein [Spirochaetales bacterium]
RKYRVLDPEERGEIMIGLRNEESIRSIANRLKRHPSVISREIKANSTEDNHYNPIYSH